MEDEIPFVRLPLSNMRGHVELLEWDLITILFEQYLAYFQTSYGNFAR